MKASLRVVWISIVLAGVAAAAETVPSPDAVLGFRVGADRQLADWTQIVDYFRRLDAASPRVRVDEVGKTTEGRPFLVVTITSEANMARLDEIRRDNLRLADPRRLSPADAASLIATGKAIVALNHGIHSNEVAATQAAMETAWRLATDEDEETRAVRDRAVVLMLPSHNPDGTQKVTEWYRRQPGQALGGGPPPVRVPEVRRSRQQPRLVHVHAGGEPADRGAPVRPLAPADRPRRAPDGTRRARACSRRPTSIPGSPTSTRPSSPP